MLFRLLFKWQTFLHSACAASIAVSRRSFRISLLFQRNDDAFSIRVGENGKSRLLFCICRLPKLLSRAHPKWQFKDLHHVNQDLQNQNQKKKQKNDETFTDKFANVKAK